MTYPHYVPNPEWRESIQRQDVSHLVAKVSEVFSSRATWQVDRAVSAMEKGSPSLLRNQELVRLIDEYSGLVWPEGDDAVSFSRVDQRRALFEALRKYPKAIHCIMASPARRDFKVLDLKTKTALLFEWYWRYCMDDAESAAFNGTRHYRLSQNIHGDVSVASLPLFDSEKTLQKDLFPDSVPTGPLVWVDEDAPDESVQSLFLYQDTTPLFASLCMLQLKSGGSQSDFSALVQSLEGTSVRHPNATDAGSYGSLRRALSVAYSKDEHGDAIKDPTGNYEYFGVRMYAGPGERRVHPVTALYRNEALVLLVPVDDGDISFGKNGEGRKFKAIMSIPKEDVLGLLSLLYRLPGRSGTTNHILLQKLAQGIDNIREEGE